MRLKKQGVDFTPLHTTETVPRWGAGAGGRLPWGQFGDVGSISGPGAGSFRLPGGQNVLGGELLHASPGR